ncbi:hypothetical protein L0152_31520 [bacterium]|nr:hypothetical protein [bacterium]
MSLIKIIARPGWAVFELITPAPYTTKTQGDTTTFESVAKSENEGEISWNGTVQGDTCEAALVWTKPGQKPIEYWFKGSLKKTP